MIILYARFSKVEALDPAVAKEDCALALKLVPELRWRWERQDNKGSHPLIARLAYKLLDGFDENPKAKPMLIDENYWVPQHILLSRMTPNIEELLLSPPSVDMPLPAGDESGGAAGPQVISIPPQAGQGPQQRQFHPVQAHASSTMTGGHSSSSSNNNTNNTNAIQAPSASSTDMNNNPAAASSSSANMPQLVNFDHFNSGNMHYFPDATAPDPGRLMNEFPYQQAPTTYNLQQMARAAATADEILEHQHIARAAAGHVPGGADPDEKYEIWQSRHAYDPHYMYRSHDYGS